MNRLFAVDEHNANLTPDAFFDAQTTTASDGEAVVRQLIEKVSSIPDPIERLDRVPAELQAGSSQALPEIERIPLHFDEEGIDGFAGALRLPQIVAMQH